MSTSAPLAVTSLSASLTDTVGTLPITCVLSWTDPNSPSAGVIVERTYASDPSCDTWTTLKTLPAGVHSYTDDSLCFGSVYRYRVTARPYQSVIFTPAAPAYIQVETQGEQNHIAISGAIGVGQGNANVASETTVTDGSHSNGVPAN